MVEVSVPTLVITVVVSLIVLGLLYLAVQRAGEGEPAELAVELIDQFQSKRRGLFPPHSFDWARSNVVSCERATGRGL